MPTTTYEELGPDEVRVWALGARTDQAGDPIPRNDQIPVEGRLPAAMWTPGVGSPAAAGLVTEVEPTAGMAVWVQGGPASGASGVFVVPYLDGSSSMLAALVDGHQVTVAAADATNPRVDQVWLVVLDEPAGAGSRRLADLAVRRGDPAASPTAPGPDAEWAAGLLLADVAVAASVTEITDADITDQRVVTQPAGGPVADGTVGNLTVTANLTGSFVSFINVAYAPPPGWNTYKIVASGTLAFQTTSNAAVEAETRVRIAGNDGEVTQGTAAHFPDSWACAAAHAVAGLAGPVTVAVRARRSASSGGVAQGGSLIVTAFKTS